MLGTPSSHVAILDTNIAHKKKEKVEQCRIQSVIKPGGHSQQATSANCEYTSDDAMVVFQPKVLLFSPYKQ